jgi:hypothetical protein
MCSKQVGHYSIVVGISVIAWLITPAMAGPCENGLSPSPVSGRDGYIERAGGQRCEGIYVSPVGGAQVELVSLTRGRLWYDLDRSGTLQIALSGVSGPARVRAVGIPDGLYYQMDADLADGRTINWPIADVLKRQRIGSDLVGVYAFRKNASAEFVYLPVDVRVPATSSTTDRPLVVILRIVGVTDPRWRFTTEGKSAPGFTPVVARTDRIEIEIPNSTTTLSGTLDVRWNDLNTGQSRSRSFMIGE